MVLKSIIGLSRFLIVVSLLLAYEKIRYVQVMFLAFEMNKVENPFQMLTTQNKSNYKNA